MLVELHPAEWNIDHSRFTAGEKAGNPDQTLPTTDELDYALVRLSRSVGQEPVDGETANGPPRGWIQLPTAAPGIVPQMPILILQHPQTEPLKLAMDTEGVLMVNANETRVRYTTNTEGGSSGSPCFDMKWNLVALHHYGDPAYQHPVTYNQGIPIDAIRKRLVKQHKENALGGPPPF